MLTLYFAIGACMPRTDFSQLMYIDDLIEHYKLHKEEAFQIGETISFHSFLYLHFIEGDEHEHDQDSHHDNLPCKTISTSSTLIAFDLTPVEGILETTYPDQPEQLCGMLSEGTVHDIFHPPVLG